MKKIIFMFLVFSLFILFSCTDSTDPTKIEEETNKFTIILVIDENTMPLSQTIVENNTMYKISIPTKNGYTFNGLYTSLEGGEQLTDKFGIFYSIPNDGERCYCHWTPKTYTINFDPDGGTLRTNDKELEVTYDESLLSFPIPEKDGYDFLGWIDGNGVQYSEDGDVLKNKRTFNSSNYNIINDFVTLYANYAVKTYNVTFDFNDYEIDSLTKVFDNNYKLTTSDYPTTIIENKDIIGWTSTYGSEQIFNGLIKEDITLYPIYKEYKLLTINDSKGNEVQEKVYKDEYFETSQCSFVNPGYEIEGWYTNEYYSGNGIERISYAQADNKYYAKWVKVSYTLTYDINTTGLKETISYEYGDEKELKTLTKEGYEFNGYCLKEDLSDEPIKSISNTLYGNHTLYAKFTGILYTITLNSKQGTISEKEVNVNYGSSYTLPVPTKEGYIFKGWFNGNQQLTDETGKSLSNYLINDNSTLTANYNGILCSVVFKEGSNDLQTLKLEYGNQIVLPELDTETTFYTYYTNVELTEVLDETTIIKSDLTIYVKSQSRTPISTKTDLAKINENPNDNYYLKNDINMGGDAWTIINEFNGVLDGQGHKISGFVFTSTSQNSGMILKNNGTIKNITFDDFTASWNYSLTKLDTSTHNSALFVTENNGLLNKIIFENGTYTANVSYNPSDYYEITYDSTNVTYTKQKLLNSGILCGLNNKNIVNCSVNIVTNVTDVCNNCVSRYYHGSIHTNTFNSSFTHKNQFGLICGLNKGNLQNCETYGKATINTSTKGVTYTAGYNYGKCTWNDYGYMDFVSGGIVGVNDSNVEYCISNAEIINNATTSSYGRTKTLEGGICGSINSSGILSKCLSNGSLTINGTKNDEVWNTGIGGLSWHNGGLIENCISKEKIVINKNCYCCGGLTGEDIGNINYCYAIVDIENNATITSLGGLTGKIDANHSIKNSFVTGKIKTSSTSGLGLIYGSKDSTSIFYRNYYDNSFTITGVSFKQEESDGIYASYNSNFKNEEFLVNTLSWNADDWVFNDDEYPTIK